MNNMKKLSLISVIFCLFSGLVAAQTPPSPSGGLPLQREQYGKRIVAAFRTNALVPLMNVGVEFPIGRHFSVGADYYSPWFWPKASNKSCFEFQGAGVYARWWFNPRALEGYSGNTMTGHSLSLVAFGAQYDFERDYKGFQGEALGAMLEYNYMFLLAPWLRMELGIGLGYALIPLRNYMVHSEGGKLIRSEPSDRRYNWVGPTKLTVGFVVPITMKIRK